MIQVTTVKGTKLAIRVRDLISMESFGNKTMIAIEGVPDKVLVLESFDELQSLININENVIMQSTLAGKLVDSE